jgi:hypothetical protein
MRVIKSPSLRKPIVQGGNDMRSALFCSVIAAALVAASSNSFAAEVSPSFEPGQPWNCWGKPCPQSPRIAGNTGKSWLGFAVSPSRRVFKSDALGREIDARNTAKKECETTTLRTCYVIAVPESADVSAVGCTYGGRSESFLGGSALNAQKDIALNKAKGAGFPESTCAEFYTY